MGTTFDPDPLKDLAKYWKKQGGRNLGIHGDTSHAARGVSYHLGKDELITTAYSIQNARDRAGLTNAASAIDLGKLLGSFPNLRVFSRWLVARSRVEPAVRKDIREIIYSPDGTVVQRYSGIDNKIHTGPGNGDLTHRKHTHISYFRDSEHNDKLAPFQPFFDVSWDPNVSKAIRDVEPKRPIMVALAIRRAGHDLGQVVNLDDLEVAMNLAHHPFGAVIDPSDVAAFAKLPIPH